MQHPTPFVIRVPTDWLAQHQPLSALAQHLITAYSNATKVEDTTLQSMGAALWQALALGETLDQAKQAAGQATLPIIIESSDAAVLDLPWETLYHPRFGFLGRASGFSLSRHNPATQTHLPDLHAEPLKILLFTALPDNLEETERLDVEAEQVAIQQAIMDDERAGKVLLEMPEDGRLATLQQALQQFQPHVVYLSAHGNFYHDLAKHQAYGSLWLEDDDGNGVAVTEAELAACFQDTQVQLLILAACKSAKQHPPYPANGLSNALSRHGIPHVIGMRESVIDAAATQFATQLLQALVKPQTVDIAVQQARAAIGHGHHTGVYRDVQYPPRTAISAGQWCLPQLLSHDVQRGLVHWQFTPQPKQREAWQQQLGEISLPERFIGRRRELRQWQNRLRSPQHNTLLITGAGGMGKTALAGKLLKALQDDGYHVFALSLRPEHNWQSVQLDMELALADNETLYKKYQLIQSKGLSVAQQAQYTLQFLQERYQHKLALLFDNLESVQQTQTPHALTDETLQHWLTAAKRLSANGLKLLVTSRWRLPDWAEHEHYALGKPVFGDYVALVRLQQLPLTGERLVRAYQTLGGNFRALTFFASAAEHMKLAEEQAFLTALTQAETAAQTDMALAKVVEQRSPAALALLHRLLAYQTAVPMDGVEAVWEVELPLTPNPSPPRGEGQEEQGGVSLLLEELLAVSLVEQYSVQGEQTTYQLAALVRSWLLANGAPPPCQALLQAAAEFLHWQLENGLNTAWEHRLATHAALVAAELSEPAQRLVLEWIVYTLNMAGMYRTLLDDWLLPLAEANNPQIKADALNQIGKQYHHLGQYDTALDFLKQSLAIQQQIGDKSGEGTSLNNISQIFKARGDYDNALDFLKQSLAIRQQIGDKSGEGTTLNNLATTAYARGDYDTALQYLQQSLAIQQQIGDKSGEGVTLSNISQIYSARGDYDSALDFLKQALAIQQQIGDKQGEGTTLNNISQIYTARGDYDTALDFLQQSLAIFQQIGDKKGEGATLNNLATNAYARGDYDSALDFLKKSLAIQQQIGDKKGEGATLNNLATNAYTRGDYDSALDFLQQSLAIRQQIGDTAGMCNTLYNIAFIQWQNGEREEAKRSWVTVYGIAQKIGHAQTLEALENLAEKLGLEGGLQGWERLAQQMNE